MIADLRNQIIFLQTAKNDLELLQQQQQQHKPANFHQKSAFMEEYDEHEVHSTPNTNGSEGGLHEFIHFQKEIKRLNEDNQHLMNENRDLIERVKNLESQSNSSSGFSFGDSLNANQLDYENKIEQLTHEINVNIKLEKKTDVSFKSIKNPIILNGKGLKLRMQNDRDKHQDEIISIQNSYKQKINSQMEEKMQQLEEFRSRVEQLENDLELKNQQLKENATQLVNIATEGKPTEADDWGDNGNKILNSTFYLKKKLLIYFEFFYSEINLSLKHQTVDDKFNDENVTKLKEYENLLTEKEESLTQLRQKVNIFRLILSAYKRKFTFIKSYLSCQFIF